jgi:hypothetical protein
MIEPLLVPRRDQPEEQVGLVLVQRPETHLVNDQQRAVQAPLGLEPRRRHGGIGLQRVHQFVQDEVRDAEAVLDRLHPSATARWLLPTRGGPRKSTFSRKRT